MREDSHMSLRAVWIFLSTVSEDGKDKSAFSRYYTTVERRFDLLQNNNIRIPEESVICESLIRALAPKRNFNGVIEEFIPKSGSCSSGRWNPVYEISLKDGCCLWPVVAIEKFGLIFACLPLVEQDLSQGQVPLIELPGVTIGYKLLHSLVDFIGPWTSIDELHTKIKDVQTFLCIAVPFGTPVDTNPATVQALMAGKEVLNPLIKRQPAWKPVVNHKGKQQLVFVIKEEIQAVQHQADSNQHVCQLFGTIVCKAELDGIAEVTVNIMSPSLEYLIVHPSVHEGSTQSQQGNTLAGSVGRRVRFHPPAEVFTLCHYSAHPTHGLPIEGIYQIKGDERAVQISLQLKLNAKVKNSFEYCEVHFPFFNRGMIVKVESGGPSHGTLMVVSGKRKLAWNIGQKFPKSLEVTFAGTVYFDIVDSAKAAPQSFKEEPFCQALNSYAQIFFKMPDVTLTGCSIDPRSVNIYPNLKISKLNTSMELLTSDYKIWNMFGDAMIMHPSILSPTCYSNKQQTDIPHNKV